MVALLPEVPPEGSPVFFLFPIVKLNLAFHPLANSYNRVTGSSTKCLLFFFAHADWAPLRNRLHGSHQHHVSLIFSIVRRLETTTRPEAES